MAAVTQDYPMTVVPSSVAYRVRSVFGARGERWLAELPVIVGRCCRVWELEVTGPAMTGGTHSYVAPVRMRHGGSRGRMAVLKVPVPDEENRAEASALHCYAGDGAVELYAFDPESQAMLMELAVPGGPLVRQDLSGPHMEGRADQADKVAVACALYRRLWRVPGALPAGFPGFATVADVVAGWSRELPKVVARHAGGFVDGMSTLVERKCVELSVPEGPVGLVNRDTHLGNIVAAQREPWLLIDPKPLLGERAYDAGFLTLIQIEGRLECEFARRVVHRTARLLGVSAERVRSWALLRAVEEVSGIPDEPFGRRCMVMANLLGRMGDQSDSVV